jgi:hypothetical protein
VECTGLSQSSGFAAEQSLCTLERIDRNSALVTEAFASAIDGESGMVNRQLKRGHIAEELQLINGAGTVMYAV